MGAVDIGIGHDDDLVVAQFLIAIGLAAAAAKRKRQVGKINQDMLVYLVDGPEQMLPDSVVAVRTTLDNLKQRFGYCDKCAKDAVLALLNRA